MLLLQGSWHLHSIELLDKLSIRHVRKSVYSNCECVQASLMLSIVLLDKLEVFCKDGFPCIMLFGWESRVTYFKENCYLYAILQYKIISHTSWLDPNCLLCVILKLSHSESRRLALLLDAAMVKTNNDSAINFIVVVLLITIVAVADNQEVNDDFILDNLGLNNCCFRNQKRTDKKY